MRRAQGLMREHGTAKMRKCRCMKFLRFISGSSAGARKRHHISYKAAPHNSARSLSRNFCPDSKFQERRNPVCTRKGHAASAGRLTPATAAGYSRFRNCTAGEKDPLTAEDDLFRGFLRLPPTIGSDTPRADMTAINTGEGCTMKRKRTAALVAAGAMMLLLAACGDRPAANDGSNVTSAVQTEPLQIETQPREEFRITQTAAKVRRPSGMKAPISALPFPKDGT